MIVSMATARPFIEHRHDDEVSSHPHPQAHDNTHQDHAGTSHAALTASRVLWACGSMRGNAGRCPFRVIRFAKSVVAAPRCWLLRSWSMLARHGDGDVMTVLTTHNDRPERSNGAKRNGAARVLVTAGALAAHLSCVRSYIAKLVDQGILERRSDGRFDQDQCRAKYIAHLKEERKRSRRLAADAEFTSAKAELIGIGIL
jgi:hypothetical protein